MNSTPTSYNLKTRHLDANFTSLNHEYEVLLDIEKDNRKTKLEYSIEVKFEKLSIESKNPIISIKRLTKTFINGVEPDLISEQISSLAGNIFCPLLLELNLKGEAIQIFDYESILKKWQKVKEKLKENYAGQTLNNYVENINQVLKCPKLVLEKLRNDWFLSLYCIPLYTNYIIPSEKEQWEFPSLIKGEGTKKYTVFKSSENIDDKDNSILIFVQDKGLPKLFTGIYTLDNKSKLIKKIEVDITEKEGCSLRAEIQCVKINKKEKQTTLIPERKKDSEEVEWRKYNDKKKGFWARLFNI